MIVRDLAQWLALAAALSASAAALPSQARWAIRAPMEDVGPRLYLIAEAEQLTPTDLSAALAGGDVACLLLRAAHAGSAPLIQTAQDAGVAVLVPDSAELMRRLGADGVHLGPGGEPAPLRSALGEDPILGVACGASRHTALEAGEAGADYVAFHGRDGRPAAPADPALLDWWQTMMTLPCVAMGDIALGDVHALAAAGADFVALADAVWRHPDGPGAAVAEANRQLDRV